MDNLPLSDSKLEAIYDATERDAAMTKQETPYHVVDQSKNQKFSKK